MVGILVLLVAAASPTASPISIIIRVHHTERRYSTEVQCSTRK